MPAHLCESDDRYNRHRGRYNKPVAPLRAAREEGIPDTVQEMTIQQLKQQSAASHRGSRAVPGMLLVRAAIHLEEEHKVEMSPKRQEQTEGRRATRKETQVTGERTTEEDDSWWTMAKNWFGGPPAPMSSSSSAEKDRAWVQRSDSMLLHLFPGLVPDHLRLPLPGEEEDEDEVRQKHNRGRGKQSAHSQRRSHSPRPNVPASSFVEDPPHSEGRRPERHSHGGPRQRSDGQIAKHKQRGERADISRQDLRQEASLSTVNGGSKGVLKGRGSTSRKTPGKMAIQDPGMWEAMVRYRRSTDRKREQRQREAEEAHQARGGESTSSSSEDGVLRKTQLNLMLKARQKSTRPRGISGE